MAKIEHVKDKRGIVFYPVSSVDAIKYDESTTLSEKLNDIDTEVNKKYQKPAGGIPASDLAPGAIPSEINDVSVSVDDTSGTPEATADLENGTLSIAFTGIKGSQGNPGPIGPAGVDSAEVSIDNTTGTPTAAVGLNSGLLTIEFTGLKGEQGNSGYQGAADELEVVNNDVDGGATSAYSAERGKALRQDLTLTDNRSTAVFNDYMVKDNTAPSSRKKRSYSISAEGLWGTSATYTHSLASVLPGDVIVVTANSTNVSYVCFLKSADNEPGTTPDFCVSTPGRITLQTNETRTFVAPLDAKFLYYYQGTESAGYPYCPISIVSFTPPTYGNIINLSDYKTWPTKLGASTTFTTSSNDHYTLIPCTPGQEFRITANNTANAEYAWFTEYIKADGGSTAPLVEETLRTYILSGTTKTIIAPETAAFLYLSVDYRDGTSYVPSKIEVPTTEDGIIDDAEAMSQKRTVVEYPSGYRLGYINADGFWAGTGRYAHIIIPCEGGETFLMKGTYITRYAFLTSYSTPVNGEAAPLVEGTVRSDTYTGVDVRITTPAGTKYLYLYGGDRNTSTAAARWSLPKVLMRVSDATALEAGQDVLRKDLNDVVLSGDILSLNPEREFIPKFMSATKRYYTSTNTEQPHPLVFLHISDIHSNWPNVERYLKFADKYKDYIDDMVNTGDTVLGLYTDGVSGYNSIEGVDNILAIIGNHETREGDDWQAHIGLDAYNLIIAPHAASWAGIVQPTGAAENGYCYYYKDYAAKNIRAIFVDIMGYDATEDSWLATTLSEAKALGYHVVIFTHFSGARPPAEDNEAAFTKVDCNYTTLYGLGTSASGLNGYNADAYLMNDTVNDFIEGGGHFVGFIQGHYHADFVAKVAKYPNQMIYSIGATKAGEMRDFNHVVGTRFQDEFQIIAIDTVNTIVKLFKVGANIDRYGRTKNSVCIDYTTGEIKGQGY